MLSSPTHDYYCPGVQNGQENSWSNTITTTIWAKVVKVNLGVQWTWPHHHFAFEENHNTNIKSLSILFLYTWEIRFWRRTTEDNRSWTIWQKHVWYSIADVMLHPLWNEAIEFSAGKVIRSQLSHYFSSSSTFFWLINTWESKYFAIKFKYHDVCSTDLKINWSWRRQLSVNTMNGIHQNHNGFGWFFLKLSICDTCHIFWWNCKNF